MRRIATALLAATLVSAAPAPLRADPGGESSTGATQRDRETFDELYRDKLREVRRTRDPEDDLLLLDQMLTFAEQVPDDPGVQGLIYTEAIALAASGGDLRAMMRAAELLEAHWPGDPAAASEKLIELAERAYQLASRDEREQVGGPYIELLLYEAEAAASREDYKSALARCRQAHAVARAIGSPHEEHLRALNKYYAAQSSVDERIDRLSQSLQANPDNYPAARELVELLLVKRDDPARANAFAKLTNDQELAELIALSAGGVEQASAAQALRVGDWYLRLSEGQPDEYALGLLARARQWYARFLDTYPRKDTLASRVRSMDELAQGRIHRIHETGVITAPPQVAAKDGWVDLMPEGFDTKKHVLGLPENISIDNRQVTLESATLIVPFKPTKAFEVRLTVTNHVHDPFRSNFVMLLPTSTTFKNRTLDIRYYATGPVIARVGAVREQQLLEQRPPLDDNPRVLTYQVATQDNGEIAFMLLVDGTPAVKWQGNTAELNFDPDRGVDDPDIGTALVIRGFTKTTIHKVEFHER